MKSKTKCIHFSRKKIDLAETELDGNKLPWVESAHHVGNILERDNSFNKYIRIKRGSIIGRVHSIFKEFFCDDQGVVSTPPIKTALRAVFG